MYILLVLPISAQAQSPCQEGAFVTHFCDQACLLCDLNNFGRRASCAWEGLLGVDCMDGGIGN